MPKKYALINDDVDIVKTFTGTSQALLGTGNYIVGVSVYNTPCYPYHLVELGESGLLSIGVAKTIMFITEDDIFVGENAEYFGETPKESVEV